MQKHNEECRQRHSTLRQQQLETKPEPLAVPLATSILDSGTPESQSSAPAAEQAEPAEASSAPAVAPKEIIDPSMAASASSNGGTKRPTSFEEERTRRMKLAEAWRAWDSRPLEHHMEERPTTRARPSNDDAQIINHFEL